MSASLEVHGGIQNWPEVKNYLYQDEHITTAVVNKGLLILQIKLRCSPSSLFLVITLCFR